MPLSWHSLTQNSSRTVFYLFFHLLLEHNEMDENTENMSLRTCAVSCAMGSGEFPKGGLLLLLSVWLLETLLPWRSH